jgi:hypothetical protein
VSSSDVSGVKSPADVTGGGLLDVLLLLVLGEEPRDLFPFLLVSRVSLITIFLISLLKHSMDRIQWFLTF